MKKLREQIGQPAPGEGTGPTISAISVGRVPSRGVHVSTLREQIGQLLTVGGIIGGLGQSEEEARVLKAIAAGEVGGVYVGYPHYRGPDQARKCIARLQAAAPQLLFISADFETGTAYNCEGSAAHLPYLMGLGVIDDIAVTQQAAEITARQALAMGINWLYSPCLDVNLRPDNPIIGIRSFGETPEKVSRMGAAFLRGCKAIGIIATAKHFPGTGNTVADTHLGNAQDVGDLKTWEEKTLPPFAEAVRNGVAAIMTGHAALPFLDPSNLPATFSAPILTELLRNRLGFKGLLISDSLGMGGVEGEATVPERCLKAFQAGCDVLLTPYDPGILPLFEQALKSGRLSEERLAESLERILQAKARLAKLPRANIQPGDETVALAIGRRAAHIRKNGGAVPLKRGSFACLTQWRNDEAQYFPREPGILAWLQHGLQVFDPGAPLIPLSRICPEAEHGSILERVGEKPTVALNAIVKNYAGDPFKGQLSSGTLALIRKLAQKRKRVVLTILGSPYAADRAAEAEAIICTFGDTLGSVEGALALLTTPEA